MTNAIAKRISDQVIKNNDDFTTFLQDLKVQTNPLVPEMIIFTNTDYEIRFQLIEVNIKLPDGRGNDDIYSVDGGKYALHSKKLQEIAQAVGMNFTESKTSERLTDKDGLLTYVSHEVRYELLHVDGTKKTGIAIGEYDYSADKSKKRTDKQLLNNRSFAGRLAETNAMSRAIKKAIPGMKSSYTLEELKKPFLVPVVVKNPLKILSGLPENVRNEVQKYYALNQLGLLDKLFPAGISGGIVSNNLISGPETEIKEDGMEQTTTFVSQEIPEAKMIEEREMSQSEENKIIAEEWRMQPQKERTEKILTLVEKKDIKEYKGGPINKSRIENNPVDSQINIIEYLLNQPDVMKETGL